MGIYVADQERDRPIIYDVVYGWLMTGYCRSVIACSIPDRSLVIFVHFGHNWLCYKTVEGAQTAFSVMWPVENWEVPVGLFTTSCKIHCLGESGPSTHVVLRV